MAAINADTQAAWQALADRLSGQHPYPGRRVRVDAGRKNRGQAGVVLRHERDRFQAFRWRYSSEASQHMLCMAGREGFVCIVRLDDGTRAWIKAQNLTVIDGGEE